MAPRASGLSGRCGGWESSSTADVPAEFIRTREEEDEGRDEPAFGRAFAPQADHEGGESQLVGQGALHQGAERIGRVADVGVGEQQELRRVAVVAAWR